MVAPQAFSDFVGDHLPQAAFLDMPCLTGEALHDAALLHESAAGGLDAVLICWTGPSSAPGRICGAVTSWPS